jgi:hypothetical protein
MTDLRDRLRDADPLSAEPALLPEEITAMRRTILQAVPPADVAPLRWKRALAIAAAALIAVAGIDTSRRASTPQPRTEPPRSPVVSAANPRTQLHFSTPGGTRIIWTLDPAFQLTEKR